MRSLPVIALLLSLSTTLGQSAGTDSANQPGEMHAQAMRALQNPDAGDDLQALTAIKEFAESGLAAAQYDLGILYLEGKLLDQDLGAANTWMEAAARQGMVD